jgi:putative MATE family efflux protein
MQAQQDAVFTQGSLMRHVSVMSVTSSIGLMAIFAVDLVDMVFIAMLGNPSLAAAVGYAGSVLFFTSSISIGLSIAAGVLVSRALGAGDKQLAAEHATRVILVGVIICALVVWLLFVNLEKPLTLLGASGETLQLSLSYLRILLPTMPVLMAAMVLMAVLRAHGDARRATTATLVGGLVNAVLDPLLIFVAGFDLEGAAMASASARITMFVVALLPVIRVYNGLSAPGLSLLVTEQRRLLAIALPSILANVATPVGTGIVTREVARFGTDAVAGMSVIGRLTPVAFAVVFALSGAIGPIVGQNFGAKLYPRVRGALNAALLFVLVYVCIAALILYFLRVPITQMFDATGEALTLVLLFCGPLAVAQIFNGWIFVSNACFNNLGHPVYATWVNWGRHTVGTWIPVTIGASLAGASGALIGQALGGVVFAAIALWLVNRVMTKELALPERHWFDQQARMHILQWRRH